MTKKHIKRFDGTNQGVEEFLASVDTLAKVQKWTDDEKVDQLIDLCTDMPFQLLSRVLLKRGLPV